MMDSTTSHAGKPRVPRGARVRIVRRRRLSGVALASLGVAIAVAVILFIFWRQGHGQVVVKPARKQVEHVLMQYKCAEGNTWTAWGQLDPRVCRQCGGQAYPFERFSCPVHGVFEIEARLHAAADGQARAEAFRVPGGEWVPARDGARCPRCDAKLARVRKEADVERQKRRGARGDG